MSFRAQSLIFPVDKPMKLIIEPEFPLKVDPETAYAVEIKPFSGIKRYGRDKASINTAAEALFEGRHALKAVDNALEIEVIFPQEDSYFIRVFVGDVQVEMLEVYALNEDLFPLTPYKGDNHMHTWMSDGKDSPMYMAAQSCRRGYDYCVITDHKLMEPSIIARDFFAETEADFLVVPGEEIHSPDNPVHIISIAGEKSVNDWWRDCEPEYRAAVEKALPDVDEVMLDADRYTAAASQVIFDKIREVNGVSVLCHPHWIITNGFNENEDVTDYLFDNRRFDALELIAGGAYEVGTQLQLSYYKARETMPVLGSSDAHGCFGGRLEPGNFTVVFAEALTSEALKQAMWKGLTVAGNENKLYGDYRLVKYAYFLHRAYFPQHKAQRDLLGSRMLRYASACNGPESEQAKALAAPRPSVLFDTLRAKVS